MVKLVKGQNDLLSQYPACTNEWDFNKNHPLSPDAVVAGSSKKVWWICCKGHSYEQSINLHVGRGYGCPYCSHRKVLTVIMTSKLFFQTSQPNGILTKIQNLNLPA